MFEHIPIYDRYRTLSLLTPNLNGEDVYALQNALNTLGYFVGFADGALGPKTSAGIFEAQRQLNLYVDGKAGGKTQTALAMSIAVNVAATERVPDQAMRGQLEHESGFRLGNYSAARTDGNYDAGVAQRNTKYIAPKDGFDPSGSIVSLAQVMRKHYDLFSGVTPSKRRWGLAQGAWNAPAFACYLARQEGATKVTAGMTAQPSASSRLIFEEYVTVVSKYL